MSTTTPHTDRRVPDPMNHRLANLLADRSLGELAAIEESELQRLLLVEGVADDATFDLAAASVSIASLGTLEDMPASLRSRLESTGVEFVSASRRPTTSPNSSPASPIAGRISPDSSRPVIRPFSLGWVAAAACLLLAVGAWWNRANVEQSAVDPSAMLQSVAASADAVRTTWQDWDNPEIKGVTGEIVWSSQLQKGAMVFKGLPKNDPSTQRYQLWIVDERGMEQRISGGLFDAFAGGMGNAEQMPDGSLCVPIDAKHAVKRAAAFALTIEEPDGIWVSDMKRRVVIATRKD